MVKETSNIIALRSKEWIAAALISLMSEKDFSKITITEIIKRADLTRQTFYRHFTSKEDVLHDYIRSQYQACFEAVERLEEQSLFNILVTYFNYWENNKDFLSILEKSRFNYNIVEFYHAYMGSSFDIIWAHLNSYNTTEIEYMKNFILGGLINVKMIWMQQGFKETSQELAQLIVDLINPTIAHYGSDTVIRN